MKTFAIVLGGALLGVGLTIGLHHLAFGRKLLGF
jgi:hypothetical protein